MEWHDDSCPRLDLFSSNGLDSCLRCGSFGKSTTAHLFPPLSKQSDTRLLRLLPGDFVQDVHCEIYVHDLSSRPEYEAISYTWADETGNDDLAKTIFVSGEPLSVTCNCENALKRIRKLDYARMVWIDAVCINQNDKNERGHQVQLMPRIYSSAQRVLIYIGERTVDSDFCFRALGWSSMNTYSSYELHGSLRHLLGRQYFSRAWVLQDVALARTATVICGDMQITWRQLCNFNLETGFWERRIRELLDTSLLKMKEAELYTTPHRFLDLLDISRRCKARDPRDKVYALVGLILDHRSIGLVADYNLTTKELYIQVALVVAMRHGWANVLFRAGTTNRSIDELPSWVPDWSHYLEKPLSPNETHQLDYEVFRYDNKDGSLKFKALTVGSESCLRVFPLPSTNIPNSDISKNLFLGHDTILMLMGPWSLKAREDYSPHYYCLPKSESKINCNQLTMAMSHMGNLLDYHCLVPAHDIAMSLTLTTAQGVEDLLHLVSRTHSLTETPWYYVFLDSSSWYDREEWPGREEWPDREALLLAIKHETLIRPLCDIDSLWRNLITFDPFRQGTLKSKGIDDELLLDLNEAIWKLLVRLFSYIRALEVKMI
ncbi:HET-domain-containing protein [Xylaria cubensis]|nr:HET-domain-containing protein [Xylaria cubensis]